MRGFICNPVSQRPPGPAQVPLPCHRTSSVTSAESLLCHQTLQRVRKDRTLQDRDCLTLNSIRISNLPMPSPNDLGSLLR